MRSSDHTRIEDYKGRYLKASRAFAALPPLRFAVGDEVEFLHELETMSEWKLGKVVELYYRERDFDITFSSPYRIQLRVDSDATDQTLVYAWVKADLDRYVRKVGVRSIEDTRYQARLNAKVEELSHVYCSKCSMQDICRTLAQDCVFVEMLDRVWQIELSVAMLDLYRMLVMYRQPFIRTDSGYHVPSSEEVVAGIRAFFCSEVRGSKESTVGPSTGSSFDEDLRVAIIAILRSFELNVGASTPGSIFRSVGNVDTMLCVCIITYVHMYIDTPIPTGSGLLPLPH